MTAIYLFFQLLEGFTSVAEILMPVTFRKMLPFSGEDEFQKCQDIRRSQNSHVRTEITYRFSLMDDQSRNMAITQRLLQWIRLSLNGGTIPDYDYFGEMDVQLVDERCINRNKKCESVKTYSQIQKAIKRGNTGARQRILDRLKTSLQT